MVVQNVIGGVGFTVVWIGIAAIGVTLFGSVGQPAAAQPLKAEVVCGVEMNDYGSGLVSCDEGFTSWVGNDSNSHIVVNDGFSRVTTVTADGIVNELTTTEDSITSYVG